MQRTHKKTQLKKTLKNTQQNALTTYHTRTQEAATQNKHYTCNEHMIHNTHNTNTMHKTKYQNTQKTLTTYHTRTQEAATQNKHIIQTRYTKLKPKAR